jgi:type II secretory pathway pseudopilin PulG
MYPDPNSQAPIDYLNQIAPQPQKPGIHKGALIAVVALIGIVLAIVIGFMMFVGNSAAGPKTDMVTLAARLQAMQTVADNAQKNIKSSQMRSVNSNLKILLTNANRDITAPLAAEKIDVKKLDKKAVDAEKADKINATLEDARLNATFDDTYAREMTYKLTTISLLMQKIYDHTKSKSMQNFLMETDDNLQPIKKQLEEFNSTAR